MVLFTSRSLTAWGKSPDALSSISPRYLLTIPFLTINSLHLYRNPMMTEFDFFSNRVERWTKDLSTLWGNVSICPHLNHLELPCHSPTELISVSGFKVWGDIQKPHHDLAFLLVCIGDTKKEIQYGVSLVWVSPHQVRTPTMEEVVEKLDTCTSNSSNWPCILAQLYEGSDHHTHSPRADTWESCPKERQRRPPVDRSANSISANSSLPAPKWSIPLVWKDMVNPL